MREVQGYPHPLGVTIGKDRMNFAAAVPEGKPCQLMLYRSGMEEPEQFLTYRQEKPWERCVFLLWKD